MAKEIESTNSKPEAAKSEAPIAIVARAFTGELYPGAVTRVLQTPDPAQPGRTVTTRKRYDLITHLQLTRVSGTGNFENTGEPFITLNGQYAPGKNARITVSAQNVAPVAAMLKGNVDKTKGDQYPLTKDITVEVVCTEMRGRGYMVQELYLVNSDGSKTAVIGALAGSAEPAAASNDLF